VAALLRARRATEAAGAQLQLAAVRPAVQRVLDLTGTSGLLRPYPSLAAARDGQARQRRLSAAGMGRMTNPASTALGMPAAPRSLRVVPHCSLYRDHVAVPRHAVSPRRGRAVLPVIAG
jgi:hypothetical protein